MGVWALGRAWDATSFARVAPADGTSPQGCGEPSQGTQDVSPGLHQAGCGGHIFLEVTQMTLGQLSGDIGQHMNLESTCWVFVSSESLGGRD